MALESQGLLGRFNRISQQPAVVQLRLLVGLAASIALGVGLVQWSMSPDYSPIMGKTPVKGFLITTGWGTWGFKAIPASGEQMAELIATGETPELIAPFSLDRFKHDRLMADRASSGTH